MRDKYVSFDIATVLEAKNRDAEGCRPQIIRPGYGGLRRSGCLTGRSTGWGHGRWTKYFTRHRCPQPLLHPEHEGRR